MTETIEKFPVGGPRQAVYNALQSRGFVQSNWSDKHWERADGLKAHIYGSGSRLALRRGHDKLFDGPMAETLEFIDRIAAGDKGD